MPSPAPRSTSRRLACAIALAVAALSFASPAGATTVTGLGAQHRNGQTFLTWNVPAGAGWTYRVYARTTPITGTADLAGATLLGTADDSSWCDRRLSSLRATVFGWAIDSLGAPLTSSRGLFVATPLASGTRWYAVTAQLGSAPEDRAIVVGQNALAAGTAETLNPPRPVYQRVVTGDYGESCEVYALWVTDQSTALFPAMSDRASMAYDIGIVRGSGGNSVLWVRGHGRGGNFLATLTGSGDPSEWRVANDDYLPNDDVATFYFGYVQGYDPFATGNPPPTSGTIRDYTWQRVLYTLDWTLATFPIDRDRVYVRGGSMGGTFALEWALHDPERIAAAQADVPKVDMTNFVDSVLPPLLFAPMWGDPASTDLPTPEGLGVYERLKMSVLAAQQPTRSEVPLVTFSGRQDVTVGWAEKIPFYAAMETNRRGGTFYWDSRTHAGVGEWDPMQAYSYLLRYRRSQSYPALAHGSLDDDPGNGSASNGTPVGQRNAYVEWDPAWLADFDQRWEVKLSLRNLLLTTGMRVAPESATVDVTPRRLQHFVVTPLATYAWSIRRLSDNVVTASGTVNADANGLVTVPAVKVYRTGSLLRINVPGPADVPVDDASRELGLAPERQPLSGAGALVVRWPATAAGTVELLDVGGRRVRSCFDGRAHAGVARVPLDAATLAAGLYWARARQGTASAVARVVVVR